VSRPSNGVYSLVYMATRTQIYLTDEQRARLNERARTSGLPMSQLIRDAVDSFLSDEDDVEATFGSSPGIGSRIPSRSEWGRHG
jgi:Ribbon-helix-helix protein, copG family